MSSYKVWAKIPPSELYLALGEHLRRNYGRKLPREIRFSFDGENFIIQIPKGSWEG